MAAEEKGCPVAAAIVEPIQAEGGNVDWLYPSYLFMLLHMTCTGDRHATPGFFRGLQAVCKKVCN